MNIIRRATPERSTRTSASSASDFAGVTAIGQFAGLADDDEGFQKFGDALRLGALETVCQGIGGDGADGGFQGSAQCADLLGERGRPREQTRSNR